jgi:hypothetical protein
MNRIKERFKLLRPIAIPFMIYIGLLTLTTTWVEDNPESSIKTFVALLPIIPSIWIAVLITQFVKKLDELEQRIINEAATFSFMITFLMIMAFSFLSISGFPLPNPVYIGLFMAILLAIGKLIGNRRYK